MIVCPNCNHQNPDGAVQCEACYTPLPTTTNCPNCGASVQTDANFCGQCGFNLRANPAIAGADDTSVPSLAAVAALPNVSEPELRSPFLPPPSNNLEERANHAGVSQPAVPLSVAGDVGAMSASFSSGEPKTRLQQQTASLLHVRSNTTIELPQNLSIIHVGKWNDRVPPDIDISGFPDSEIVSRIHADIRVEGDAYYIEDVGSSNGTYINNMLLPLGNRHRLRPGDRISLGKGDRVTFLFQIS